MKPLTPATPRAIIMVGIPGAGKTAFAEHFAGTFHAPFVNTRSLLAHGLDATQALSIGNVMLDEIMKTSRTLVYEGMTDTKASRTALAKYVAAQGYQPLFVWVQTESAEAQRRAIRKQKDTPALTADEFVQQVKRFTPPSAQEKVVVISGKHTYASQLKIVLKRLAAEQRPEASSDQRPRSSRGIILR